MPSDRELLKKEFPSVTFEDIDRILKESHGLLHATRRKLFNLCKAKLSEQSQTTSNEQARIKQQANLHEKQNSSRPDWKRQSLKSQHPRATEEEITLALNKSDQNISKAQRILFDILIRRNTTPSEKLNENEASTSTKTSLKSSFFDNPGQPSEVKSSHPIHNYRKKQEGLAKQLPRATIEDIELALYDANGNFYKAREILLDLLTRRGTSRQEEMKQLKSATVEKRLISPSYTDSRPSVSSAPNDSTKTVSSVIQKDSSILKKKTDDQSIQNLSNIETSSLVEVKSYCDRQIDGELDINRKCLKMAFSNATNEEIEETLIKTNGSLPLAWTWMAALSSVKTQETKTLEKSIEETAASTSSPSSSLDLPVKLSRNLRNDSKNKQQNYKDIQKRLKYEQYGEEVLKLMKEFPKVSEIELKAVLKKTEGSLAWARMEIKTKLEAEEKEKKKVKKVVRQDLPSTTNAIPAGGPLPKEEHFFNEESESKKVFSSQGKKIKTRQQFALSTALPAKLDEIAIQSEKKDERSRKEIDSRSPVNLPEIHQDNTEDKEKDFDKFLTFRIKILAPVDLPNEILQRKIEGVFNITKNLSYIFVKKAMLPRAEYEEQLSEWIYDITIKTEKISLNKNEQIFMLYKFLETFCQETSIELHDQLMIEVMDWRRLIGRTIVYQPTVPFHELNIGNCVNRGLFYSRGSYMTSENKVTSNQILEGKIMKNINLSKANDKGAHPAGKEPFCSFANFEHDRKTMNFNFAVRIPVLKNGLRFIGYRFVINYSSLIQVFVDSRDDNFNHIYFRLKNPPQLWQAENGRKDNLPVMNLNNIRRWTRVFEFSGGVAQEGRVRFPGCTSQALTDSLWLRVAFSGDNPGDCIGLLELVSRIKERSNVKLYFGAIAITKKGLPNNSQFTSIGSFRADYAVNAMISRGSVITDQLYDCDHSKRRTTEHVFFQLARWCFIECQSACEEALENLLAAVDERRNIEILRAFKYMYDIRVEARRRVMMGGTLPENVDLKKALPKNCVLVRKIMVTPRRKILMAPEVMMTNRVIRKFGEEYALRCVFRDEDGTKLKFSEFSDASGNASVIRDMVEKTLVEGIKINDRVYKFLAWSNSQMRDAGCYMFAEKKNEKTGEVIFSVDHIRQWMGDFNHIKSVPKLMSRMGQCLTQAMPTVTLEPETWIVEADYEGGKGHKADGEPYCFTDGCGRLAPSIARQISRILELELIPSCFQVRFKGFKGILVVDPNLDLAEGGPKVVFRKSQQKFEVEDNNDSRILEVVKYSMPTPLCFNRPMIAILDYVTERQSSELHRNLTRRIHYYNEKELTTLGEMLFNEKIAAEQMELRINLPIEFSRLRRHGISMTDEPFFRRMMLSVYRCNIINNLSKQKIFLPGHQGRSMYGVVDETGLLQYGQVFIQYSPSLSKSSKTPKLYLGPVLISKNPCHVAGDCRMFTAIYQPALEHLIDVVVFPRYGPRPHPDEMAGSDLDGDEYCVIFDPKIKFNYNHKPMHYPKMKGEEFKKPPTTKDMVEFFLTYLRYENIGMLSNAHLVMTEKHGLFHRIPKELAVKCSIAVDFPKSGIPAANPKIMELGQTKPDFMTDLNKPVYKSKRLNGQLYRRIKKIEDVMEVLATRESIYEGNFDEIIALPETNLFEGCEPGLKKKYQKLRDEYATRMQQLLDEYGITEEAQIVSGHIVSLKRITAMERDDYSFYHTDKIVELRYLKIYNHFRSIFLREFGEEENLYETNENEEIVLKVTGAMKLKARQWYYLAYVDNREHNKAPGPCKSFPWVVWDVLATYKREALLMKHQVIMKVDPIGKTLDNEITDFIRSQMETFNIFCNSFDENDIIKRYIIAYGDKLTSVLFVLSHWLEIENLFKYTTMTMKQVYILFIQFCRGTIHGGEGVDHPNGYQLVFPQPAPNPPYYLALVPENIAMTLLEFLRYLGSQSFALSRYISLKIDNVFLVPALTRNEWLPLSLIAFRTFHQIAVSGQLDALHFYREKADTVEFETTDPIVVDSDLLSGFKNGKRLPISSSDIVATLKKWSGVSFMKFREDNPQKKRKWNYLCTVRGTVAARQRAVRLLQMDQEKLLKAVCDDRIPMEMHDLAL